MKNAMTVDELNKFRGQLRHVRQQFLDASRQNDFRTVARLTGEAARLNRLIQWQEEFAGFSPKSLAVVDSLAQFEDAGQFVIPEETPSLVEVESDPALCQEAAQTGTA